MTFATAPPAGALSALPDAALVTLVAGGSATAFETLDRRHRPTVLRQCACLLHSSHDAEEATQQAMFAAYRALAAGKVPKCFPAWLTTIARNECFDMIRARKGVEPLLVEVAAGGETLPERVERRERIETLKRDLVELPEAQRRALVLRGAGDLSHAEIARLLGGTPTEMRTLVHEARSSLAEFEAGRELDCDMVRERISSGDGRALRARRVRAHLRACDSCATVAGRHTPGRRGFGALLPFPIFGAIRAALFGGGAGVAGPVAVVAVSGAFVASLVIGIGGGVAGGALSSDPAPATLAGQARVTAAAGSAPSSSPSGGATRTRTTTRTGAPTAAGAAGSTPAAGSAPAAGGSGAPSSAFSSPSTPAVSAAVPSFGVPSVRVPAVAVPSAGVPAVRVPPVAVPPVTVPSVTVPPVTTPALPIVGSVTTPPVVTPQVVTPPISTPQIVVPPIQVPPVQVPPLVP